MDARYNPFTGTPIVPGAEPPAAAAAALALEPPRFCDRCGRRMVVQVTPLGWQATCSRHGVLDSHLLDQR